MAETILRGWNMTQIAASVTLDGRTGKLLDRQASAVHNVQGGTN